jgi:hypothetical protein
VVATGRHHPRARPPTNLIHCLHFEEKQWRFSISPRPTALYSTLRHRRAPFHRLAVDATPQVPQLRSRAPQSHAGLATSPSSRLHEKSLMSPKPTPSFSLRRVRFSVDCLVWPPFGPASVNKLRPSPTLLHDPKAKPTTTVLHHHHHSSAARQRRSGGPIYGELPSSPLPKTGAPPCLGPLRSLPPPPCTANSLDLLAPPSSTMDPLL